MTPWQVLGIDPTADPRKIKKAYASRLKRCHPEDDPEGFQLIRLAYEEALSWAEDHEEQPPVEHPPPEEISKVANLMEVLKASLDLALAPQERETKKEAPRPRKAGSRPRSFSAPTAGQRREERDRVSRAVDALMRKVKALGKRNEWGSEKAWTPLLEGEVLWDLDIKSGFQSALFDFLGLERRELSRGVWRLLDQRFRWVENAQEFYRSREASTVDWVLERIHDARRFRPVLRPVRPRPSVRLRLNDERELFSLLPESQYSDDLWFFLIFIVGPFLPNIARLFSALSH